jgi:hypothetical protein
MMTRPTPFSPPSGLAQRLFQEPPAKSKFLAVRNSGFIISTILSKISFSADGIVNVMLILGGVSFGVAILWAHDPFERPISLPLNNSPAKCG